MAHSSTKQRTWTVEVAGTGFTVLDRIYTDGGLADQALGGSCGNVLVSLAMLDRKVAPVLALGRDDTGDQLVREFREAGADVNYIQQRAHLRSPILAQELDMRSGRHDFSFTCPETKTALPRYQPIEEEELTPAMLMVSQCAVFYADRLTETIYEAMQAARWAGATVFFEPSAIGDDEDLFGRALAVASVLKYSGDRLGDRLANVHIPGVRIVTHGAAGLEVTAGGRSQWSHAIYSPNIVDTCGSGDMVSVGVIDWILTNGYSAAELGVSEILKGVVAGQRLATENCAYAGARGLFRARGADYVRQLLSDFHATA